MDIRTCCKLVGIEGLQLLAVSRASSRRTPSKEEATASVTMATWTADVTVPCLHVHFFFFAGPIHALPLITLRLAWLTQVKIKGNRTQQGPSIR